MREQVDVEALGRQTGLVTGVIRCERPPCGLARRGAISISIETDHPSLRGHVARRLVGSGGGTDGHGPERRGARGTHAGELGEESPVEELVD